MKNIARDLYKSVDEYADYGKSDSYLIPTAKETLRQSWLASKPNVRAVLTRSYCLSDHGFTYHCVAASVLVVLVHRAERPTCDEYVCRAPSYPSTTALLVDRIACCQWHALL